jgi:hypothetical protein
MMTLLDGTTRNGLPIVVTGLPEWSPVVGRAEVSLFVEGGTYTSDGGAWHLDLTTSAPTATGRSATWNDFPTGTGSVGFTGFSVSPAVVANSGDSAAGIRIDIISTVLTGFNYRVLNQTTGAVVPNATVRINWVAIGATAAA